MIIFNLDGTLADFSHRTHFLKHPNTPPKWKEFYEACDRDTPISEAIKVFRKFQKKCDVQIWSGRCESVRQKTLDWIFYSGIDFPQNITLKMRSIGDDTRWDELKEKWANEVIESGNKIDFVFDSDSSMWRRKGVFVFKNFSSTNLHGKGV